MEIVAQEQNQRSEGPDARRRREAMIAVAQRMFFERGYAATSMSSVAAAVGGSKTTLWAYFPSKRALFEAVVDHLVERYGSMIENVPLHHGDLEKTLKRFGRVVLEVVVSPEVLALYRLVVGEGGRFAELGDLYHQKGPGRAEFRLQSFIGSQMTAGRLRTGDPKAAAAHFLAMCQANHAKEILFNLASPTSEQRLNLDVDVAVWAFLRTYATQN